MGTKILLFIITAVAFTSCTTAYKSGQTPDDVYYSPRRVYDESKERRQDDDRTARRDDDAEERRIRRSINDRRWRWLDDDITFNRSFSPWAYGYNYGYYYNPLFCNAPVYNVIHVKNSTPKVFTPRTTSLASYSNTRNYNNSNTAGGSKFSLGSSNARARGYNNSNSGGGSKLGNVIGKIFSGATQGGINNSSGNSSSGNRSYSPSSSGGSKSGGSSGGSASRPARNGKG